jgi:hypothetical protein
MADFSVVDLVPLCRRTQTGENLPHLETLEIAAGKLHLINTYSLIFDPLLLSGQRFIVSSFDRFGGSF